ncbi:hypothetical protein V7127_25205 [Bacillus sp. JJ1773]
MEALFAVEYEGIEIRGKQLLILLNSQGKEFPLDGGLNSDEKTNIL